MKKILYFILDFIATPIVIFLACFNPHFAHGKIISMESGQHLAWAHAILNGKIPYRDVWMQYGPLQEYILASLMWLFGKTLLVQRAFFYIGIVLALIAGYFLARQIIRNRFFTYVATWLLITETIWPFWMSRWGGFRVGFGFLGVLLLVLYNNSKKKIYLYLTGMISMLAFLYSLEYGILLFGLSIIYLLASHLTTKEPKSKLIFKEVNFYILGILTILIPFLVYYAWIGALKEFVRIIFQDFIISYPCGIVKKAATSSPGVGVPWLNLQAIDWAKNGWKFVKSLHFKFYLYLFMLLITALYLTRKFLRKVFSVQEGNILVLGIFSLGIFIFGLRRFPSPQFSSGLCGVVILVAFFLKESFYALFKKKISVNKKGMQHPVKYEVKILASLFIIFFIWYYGTVSKIHIRGINFIEGNLSRYGTAPKGLTPFKITYSGNIFIPPKQAAHISKVVNYIKRRTSDNENIYVFPHEAFYYFFANRGCPTRFHIAIAAGYSPAYQQEVVRDLKKDRTKYIIYGTASYRIPDTNPIDNEAMIPEIVRYIKKAYTLEREFGDTLILKRID